MLQAHSAHGSPRLGGRLPASRPGFARKVAVLLAVLVIARGLVLMCVMPPFEGWDEYQHVGYLQHLIEGAASPVVGQTNVPRSVLEGAVAFPQPHSAVLGGLSSVGGLGYADYWAARESGIGPTYREGDLKLYQAQHGPLSYRVMAPVFSVFGGAGDLRNSVAGVRLLNLLMTAAAVVASFLILARNLAERRAAAWVGLILATYPLFLMNGVRVANDGLAVLFATLTVGLGLSLSAKPWPSRSRFFLAALATGLMGGMAVLAKATNYALAPFLGFCVLMVSLRPEIDLRRAAACGAAMVTGFLAVTQAEMRFNLAHYGSISSMQEAAVNHARGLGRADLLRTAMEVPWATWAAELWSRKILFAGGWSFQGTHPRSILLHRDLVALGLMGWAFGVGVWIIARRRREQPALGFADLRLPLACAVLVAVYTAALGYHTVQSRLAWGEATTGPWYASPAMPWFLTLVVLGLMRWPIAGRSRTVLVAAMAGVSASAEILGLFGRMIPAYTGFAGWPEALARLASMQPRWLGTPTLAVAVTIEVVALAALVLVIRDDARFAEPGRHVAPPAESQRRAPAEASIAA